MENNQHDAADRMLRISKTLPAPVHLVWEVWTSPGHIENWWGPEGFTNTIHSMDVSDGGEWRFTMHGPDGKSYANRSIFEEVVPFKKIAFQHFNPNFRTTVVFQPDKKETHMEWTMLFETKELFETVVKAFKADEGLEQNVRKLEHYLKQNTRNN